MRGSVHYKGLLKLLLAARREAERSARFLTDLERSRQDAAGSLDRLDAAIREEEAVALGRADIGFRDFAGYLAGAAAKRAALLQSCRALDAEIVAAREALTSAEIERRKLDHLVDLVAAAIRSQRRKRENSLLDDAGRRRGQRR